MTAMKQYLEEEHKLSSAVSDVIKDELESGVTNKTQEDEYISALIVEEPTSYSKSLCIEEEHDIDPARLINLLDQMNVYFLIAPLFGNMMSSFIMTPLSYYILKILKLGSEATNFLGQVTTLPSALQLPIGLLIDCVPIYGHRRKPYMIIGWIVQIGAYIWLSIVGDPNYDTLLGMILVAVIAMELVNLSGMALVVQRSKFEDEKDAGKLIATIQVLSVTGNLIGSALGTFCYESNNFFHGRGGMGLGHIGIFCVIVSTLLVCPTLYFLHDPEVALKNSSIRPLREELVDVFHLVQRRSVLLPMLFLGLLMLLDLPNSAFSLFLVEGLHFTEWQLGLIGIVGVAFSAFASLFYRLCLMHVNWRYIFVFTTILMVAFTGIQLILVFRTNIAWGIPDFFFALGDDFIDSFVGVLRETPIMIMYMNLCPGGSEGTAFATFQTFLALAELVAFMIGQHILKIWDVSRNSIISGDYTGIWKLTLFTGLLPLVTILFVRLIPRNVHYQREMQRHDIKYFWGGFAFLFFCIMASLVTFTGSILSIIKGFRKND